MCWLNCIKSNDLMFSQFPTWLSMRKKPGRDWGHLRAEWKRPWEMWSILSKLSWLLLNSSQSTDVRPSNLLQNLLEAKFSDNTVRIYGNRLALTTLFWVLLTFLKCFAWEGSPLQFTSPFVKDEISRATILQEHTCSISLMLDRRWKSRPSGTFRWGVLFGIATLCPHSLDM